LRESRRRQSIMASLRRVARDTMDWTQQDKYGQSRLRSARSDVENPSLAVLLALLSTLCFGAAFVLAQIALRWMPPWLGAAFSVPTSTLLFCCLASFTVDIARADLHAVAIFAGVGLFFPATVTLLNFESNRLVGPNIAGALGGLAPLFAVLLAWILLGESLHLSQLFGIAAIAGGVMLMFRGRRLALTPASFWMVLPALTAAAVRGVIQPVIKFGLELWPSSIAAAVIGYTISSAVLILFAILRNRGMPRHFDRRGALWFAAVGICNGLAVLLMYAALGRGPVALVSPLVASYPLITVLLSHLFLKEEPVNAPLMAAVAATVAGVVILIVA
jgi:drug/metabolite transporter (DMT)-like permease